MTSQLSEQDFVADLINKADLQRYRNLCEFWDINGSSQKLAYLTHNYFRYFGKFPSTIAKRLIQSYTKNKNELVIDTMVGSGTTLVEAAIANRKAIGFDVNPFSVLLSNVKVTKLDTAILENEYKKMQNKFRKLTKSEIGLHIPSLINIDHWFNKKTQYELAEIKHLINKINNLHAREFFLIGFASILRRVSCAGSQTGRLFHDKNWEYRDPYELFTKQYEIMKERMEELNQLTFPKIYAEKSNAISLPLPKNVAKLVICHPPYYNLYKFSHTNKFELLWLGFDHKDVTKNEIFDGFKLGSIEKYKFYLEDIKKVILEMYRILAPNGRAALMIGDSIVQKRRVYITKDIVNYIGSNGIKIEKIILRKPKFAEASYATALRRKKEDLGHDLTDFIIIFKK